MSATIEMKLKPWTAPNFAQVEMPPAMRQDGVRELPSVAVADLSQTALDGLVRQWIEALYTKAKKPNGWSTIDPA